jgi:hypothetical protein
MTLSTDFHWGKTGQARLFVFVDKAVETILALPRDDQLVDLVGWKIEDVGRHSFVICAGALPAPFRYQKLPVDLDKAFPVILGTVRNRIIVVDGAHRIAAFKITKRQSIRAFALSEEETLACVEPLRREWLIEEVNKYPQRG